MHRLDPTATLWHLVEGEVVALDLRTQEYLAINPSGAVLWPLLAQGADDDGLTAALVDRFGLDHEQAAHDAAAFVEALSRRGLLAAG